MKKGRFINLKIVGLWLMEVKKTMSKSKRFCIDTDCRKCEGHNLKELLCPPFEIGNRDIEKLFSFFLHQAPTISSVHSDDVSKDSHAQIFATMMENRHFKYQKICAFNTRIENELSKGFLLEDNLCFKCKRYVSKRRGPRKGKRQESDLECFLRHIRNAIAHGRVYYKHSGNRIHILFEDRNDNGKLTARIICIKADLEYWKKVLMVEQKGGGKI